MDGCTDKWVFRHRWVDRQTDRVQYGTLFDTTKPRIRLILGKLFNFLCLNFVICIMRIFIMLAVPTS